MITPEQARQRADAPGAETNAFEQQIDAAIEEACDTNRWPVCVNLREHAHVAERVAARYRRTGWTADIVRDQRDGDYLKLERPWRP